MVGQPHGRAVTSLAALVGTRVPLPARPHVEFATVDTIRNFARSTGDDNPLHGDPSVAARSVRGGLVAPPLFLLACGNPARGEPASRPAALASLAAPQVTILEDRWAFGALVRPGTRLERADVITAVERHADAVAVTTSATYSCNQVWHGTFERIRLHHDAVPGGPAQRAKARYTDDEIAAIEREVLAWRRRGANTRAAHDVQVGDTFGPLVKGPLTVTDLVAYRAGVGAGPFDVEPLALAVRNRQARPDFYDRTDTNAWDARERLHWDEAYAISKGHPSAYDYSHTRLVWASQLLGDWMGDAGRLLAITFSRHADNYVGDTHWLRADVAAIAGAGAIARVDVSYRATNQLGVCTASGTATIALPVALDGVA